MHQVSQNTSEEQQNQRDFETSEDSLFQNSGRRTAATMGRFTESQGQRGRPTGVSDRRTNNRVRLTITENSEEYREEIVASPSQETDQQRLRLINNSNPNSNDNP